MTRELVYGRNAGPRGAARAAGRARGVGGERAAATPRLARRGAAAAGRRERELTEAAGSPDHQGVVAWCEPYPYADAWELAAASEPLLCCLDQVTDPRNLGAVVRSAAGAGATGVVLPAHGAARVTAGGVPRFGGRGRAPAGRGRAESRPIPRRGQGRPALGVCGGRRRRPPLWDVDLTGGVALVLGAEGKGVRPLVRRTCDGAIAIPLAHGVESLNVSVAAAVALFEARRQRYFSTSTGG